MALWADNGKKDDEDSDEFEIELEDDEAPEDDASAATLSSSDATLADVNLSGNPKTATHPAALAPLIPDEDFLEGPLPEALVAAPAGTPVEAHVEALAEELDEKLAEALVETPAEGARARRGAR